MQSLGIKVLFEGSNLLRLFGGLLTTAEIALISIIIGSLLGILFGLLRLSKSKTIRFIFRLYLELFRVIPILVWLYIVYFGVSIILNLQLDGIFVSIVVFSLWGAAEMSDIVRGSLQSLPKHQIESGKSLGLSKRDIYKYILIPQAIRRMIPGAINLATRMVKTTSLVVLIGVIDVVKVGQQIIELSLFKVPTASFWIYGFIFFLYFIICYPLSLLSKVLETKWNS